MQQEQMGRNPLKANTETKNKERKQSDPSK